MNVYVGDMHSKGTEADPHCNTGPVCRDKVCIRFPPEWMNNKSFILLSGGDNSGRYTEAIKVVGAWQRMHIWLVSNIQRTGGGVLCNSASYCDVLGRGRPSAQPLQPVAWEKAAAPRLIQLVGVRYASIWRGGTDLSCGTENQYSCFLPCWAYCCMEALALETKVFFMGFPTRRQRNLWERVFFPSTDPAQQDRKCNFRFQNVLRHCLIAVIQGSAFKSAALSNTCSQNKVHGLLVRLANIGETFTPLKAYNETNYWYKY